LLEYIVRDILIFSYDISQAIVSAIVYSSFTEVMDEITIKRERSDHRTRASSIYSISLIKRVLPVIFLLAIKS